LPQKPATGSGAKRSGFESARAFPFRSSTQGS
jgi:hypothetical protein